MCRRGSRISSKATVTLSASRAGAAWAVSGCGRAVGGLDVARRHPAWLVPRGGARRLRAAALRHLGDQRSGALLVGIRDGDVVVLGGQSARRGEVTLSVHRPVREKAEEGTPRRADRSAA